MSFYDYGRENLLFQSSPRPLRLQFYFKCLLDCFESSERREVIDSYSSILVEAQSYLTNMIEVVFDGKRFEGDVEIQIDYSYLLSGLEVQDLPRAKSLLLATIEEIELLRKNTWNRTGRNSKFDYTKVLDRVISSYDSTHQMLV